MKNNQFHSVLRQVIYNSLDFGVDPKIIEKKQQHLSLPRFWSEFRHVSFGLPRGIGKTGFIIDHAWENHIIVTRNFQQIEDLTRKYIETNQPDRTAKIEMPSFYTMGGLTVDHRVPKEFIGADRINSPFEHNYIENLYDYSPLGFKALNIVWFDEVVPDMSFFEVWEHHRRRQKFSFLDIFISLHTPWT